MSVACSLPTAIVEWESLSQINSGDISMSHKSAI